MNITCIKTTKTTICTDSIVASKVFNKLLKNTKSRTYTKYLFEYDKHPKAGDRWFVEEELLTNDLLVELSIGWLVDDNPSTKVTQECIEFI